MWFFRDPDRAKWRRYEPWTITLVDVDNGTVLGVVHGRGTGVKKWLQARTGLQKALRPRAALGRGLSKLVLSLRDASRHSMARFALPGWPHGASAGRSKMLTPVPDPAQPRG